MGCLREIDSNIRDVFYEIYSEFIEKFNKIDTDVCIGTCNGAVIHPHKDPQIVYRYEFKPSHFTIIAIKWDKFIDIPIPFTGKRMRISARPKRLVCAEIKINNDECLVKYFSGASNHEVEATKWLIRKLSNKGIINPEKILEAWTHEIRKAWKYPGEEYEY